MTQEITNEYLLEIAPVGLIVSNTEGQIIKCNDFFKKLVGLGPTISHEGLSIYDFLSIGSKIFYETHYFPLLKLQGEIREISLDLIDKEDRKIPVLLSSKLIKNENLIYTSIVDIRQRNSYEKELLHSKKYADELNIKLTAQKDELEKLNILRQRFLSILSHDIKSPLNSLHSFMDIIENEQFEFSKAELQNMVLSFRKSIDNTIKLASNLIEWSSAEINQINIEKAEFSLSNLLREQFLMQKDQAESKGVNMKFECDEDVSVFASRNQILFVARNFISNALKFTKNNGEIVIKVGYTQIKEPFFCVKDSGIGLTTEQINQFYTQHKIDSKLGTSGEKGSGIGLSLCNDFIKSNNSVLEIESKKEIGSSFKVIFKNIDFERF